MKTKNVTEKQNGRTLLTAHFRIELFSMDQIGQIFTENTFSKYYTREVLCFLDPVDLRQLCVVNSFCKNLCATEEVLQMILEKNMKSRHASFNTLVECKTSAYQW
jgi:hypothetical protein